MRRVKAKKTRLLASGLLLFSLTACEISVGDISNSFSDFPAPEPVEQGHYQYYNMETSPFATTARFLTAEWGEDDLMRSNRMSEIAKNLAALVKDGKTEITVALEGHADMRCTESTWQKRRKGPNPDNSTGTWCSPRDTNNTTPQGRQISLDRAKTVKTVLEKLLIRNHTKTVGSIAFEPKGLGEKGARATAQECVHNENSTNCQHDRRVDVYVSARTPPVCVANCTPTTTSTTTSTTTTTTIPPPPPPVSVAPVVRAFQNAQQNSDQRIVVKAATLICAGCQQPPANTSDVLYGWTATLDSGTVSFTLTPPSGYASPRDYKMTSNPNGKSALSDQTAVMRFYTATRSGMPYRYSATSTVNYTLRLWRLEGTTLTYVRQESSSQSQVATCSPSSCSFGVLGSNVG
jgi:outer membrane protein OmpA-like peptidoglycan-associated protein